jgi:hypothetical protein
MHRGVRILVAVSALASPAATVCAEPKDDVRETYGKLQPYRAVYGLRQVARAAGTAPVRVSGRMTTETRVGCKDYEVQTSMTMRVESVGRGVDLESEWKIRESLDGRTFSFSMQMSQQGRLVRRHEAEALLQSRDGPGRGTVKRGAPEALKLAPGTVLPGTHGVRSLAAAAAGKREIKHRVYLGEDDVRLADVSTTITGAGSAPANAALGAAAGKAGWSFRDVVRSVVPRQNGEPRVNETFVTNEGVTTFASFTVQGLTIATTPLKIEMLPKPACR